jgi:hypothetical protein
VNPASPRSGFTNANETRIPHGGLTRRRCRNAQEAIRKLILLEQFQTGLPLNRKAIMLRANWR